MAAAALGCVEPDGTASPQLPTTADLTASGGTSDGAATAATASSHPDAAVGGAPAAGAPDPWPEPGRWLASEEPGDRVFSKVRFLWIRPLPGPTKRWLGYLSLGDSVRVRDGRATTALRGDAPTDGDRCRSWYAVEPRGYVCVGADATLDQSDATVAELRATAAKPSSAWPYEYGESLGTPIYRRVPDAAEQRRHEADLPIHLDKVRRLRQAQNEEERARIAPELAGAAIGPTHSPVPSLVELSAYGRGIRTRVWPGSTIAYTRSFDAGNRSWLLTWDRGIVPADRVRPYPQVQFSGVPLTADRRLPIAFFRSRARPQYRRAPDGHFEPTGKSWPRHGWVALTGNESTAGSARFLETTDEQLYCAAADATVVTPVERIPETVARRAEGRRTWLDISVLGGWLVAYEGDQPVYATLVAPGRGGVPFRGVPAIDTASTPTGQFTVTGKFVTATMASTSDANLMHSEVQYTQNFSGPHALHGAYWHDGWGEKMSGGCVNLSPIDSRRIFAWTDPPLPPGWHGVRWIPAKGESTAIVIHR